MKEISLHILDLMQNSIRAGAKNIQLRIEEDTRADTFTVIIQDDGCGMSPEMTKAVSSPQNRKLFSAIALRRVYDLAT